MSANKKSETTEIREDNHDDLPVDFKISDSDLQAELDALTDDETKNESEEIAAVLPEAPADLPATSREVIDLIKKKFEMYKLAETSAKANRESAKVRRCERGLKTLYDLYKQALSGQSVDVNDIPPEISAKTAAPQSPTPA